MTMNTACRTSSRGARRERRLGAYRGAIADLVLVLLLSTDACSYDVLALWRWVQPAQCFRFLSATGHPE